MYRVLIVDDEPIIVEGLVDYFARYTRHPLEVYGAYSAEEALDMLLQTRLDIVITDIHMPGMGGLELQKRIMEQWPRCKLIFLTGHTDFEYVRQALRYEGVDYVLKAEGDASIERALERAIDCIKDGVHKQALLTQAEKQLRLALPALQRELLQSIVQGEDTAFAGLPGQFDELDIPLDASTPVLMVLARLESSKPGFSVYDRGLVAYAVQNIAGEYFGSRVRSVSSGIEHTRVLWFLQPPKGIGPGGSQPTAQGWQQCIRFVQGTLETVQQVCKQVLGLTVSFIMEPAPVPWQDCGRRYERYSLRLSQGLGMGTELLLTHEPPAPSPAVADFNARRLAKQLEQLGFCLENGQQEAFNSLYLEIMSQAEKHPDSPHIRQEIYYSLVPVFLSFIHRAGGAGALGIDAEKLTHMEAHASWAGVGEYFRTVADTLFATAQSGMRAEENSLVKTLHQYIQNNLGGDVSLVRLGEVVGYNSKYLSRLYKKVTGEDLSAYISNAKLLKAQKLLAGTDMKIYEISTEVGFLSEPYFYRFFRGAVGLTPQEYRDKSTP